MTLHSDLAKVMTEEALVLPTDGSIILREEDPSARMEVAVAKPSTDVITIDMGKLSHSSAIKDVRGYRVKCDYLLLFESDGNDHAILIELKKTLGDNVQGAEEQLRRSLPLLEYLRSFCEVHYDTNFTKSEMSIRYFLIGERYSKRFDKQPVNADPAKRLHKEKYRGITITTFVGSRIHFTMLSTE